MKGAFLTKVRSKPWWGRRRLVLIGRFVGVGLAAAGYLWLSHSAEPPPLNPEVVELRPVQGTVAASASARDSRSAASASPTGPRAELSVDECALTQRVMRDLMNGSKSNLVWSPHSLALGLSLVALGAHGETLEEILNLMEFEGSSRELAASLNELDAEYLRPRPKKSPTGFDYQRGLGIWTIGLVPAFQQAAEGLFPGVELREASFDTPRGRARAIASINAWASKRTRGRIRKLLPPDWIPDSGSTGTILVNTLFFASLWGDMTEVRQGTFRTAVNRDVATDFVVLSGRYGFIDHPRFTIVSMPLASGLPIAFVLPKGEGQASDLLSASSCGRIEARVEHVHVEVPKFHVGSKFDLKEGLRRLGVQRMFEQDLAGLHITPKGKNWIHAVRQCSDIELDERGIVAASGTAVQDQIISAPRRRVTLDRPFLFFLLGHPGQVLFAGRVADPSQKEGE